MRYLHLARTIGKQYKELQRAGKKAEHAVSSFVRIVDSLRRGEAQDEFLCNKRTKNGELRLRHCIKYDLGGGYRMVTVRNDQHLFVLFIGTHDETDQWLENHRDDIFSPDDASFSRESIGQPRSQGPDTVELQDERFSTSNIDTYERELMARLDESLLRAIFQGLYSKQDHHCHP